MVLLSTGFVSEFLLEIGTEELPADFARLAVGQLEQIVLRDLKQCRLSYGEIWCSTTPRRIALLVKNLAAKALDFEEERKGPPAAQAFKDGLPTQAALGFASRYGLAIDDLIVHETSKGPFVFGKIIDKGAPATELLTELIPKWVENLQGQRFMRWGTGELRFPRPVRWLVAMLDESIVPLSLEGCDPKVSTSNLTRGHRLHYGQIAIPKPADFLQILESVGVQADREKRKKSIQSSVNNEASKLNSRIDFPESLLDELTDLVESPLLIEASFDEEFLDLPAEVLSTVMKVHQRYIPLYNKKTSEDLLALNARNILLNRFLLISNGLKESVEIIRLGNERVLKARLADAQFFVSSDLSISCKKRVEKLSTVNFSEGLGSLSDRVSRMEWLANLFAEELDFPEETISNSLRAAHFSKHDLVSQIVSEFPELQGVMGAKYLLADGENKHVALAVLEHYLPRWSGDRLPGSDPGAVVALAERFELLLSIYAKGERPSGSSDPYALKRAGNGFLQIIWSRGWKINLLSLVETSTLHWRNLLKDCKFDASELTKELSEFIRQRMFSLLEDSMIDNDLIQAVVGENVEVKRLLEDPLDVRIRADLLTKMRQTGQLLSVQAVVTRAARLADKCELSKDILCPMQDVDPGLFDKKSENEMLKVLNKLKPIVESDSLDRYERLADQLVESTQTLANFFDGDESVMVMTDSLDVRKNRLNMLGILCNQASVLADFKSVSG